MDTNGLSEADRTAVERFLTEWLTEHRVPGAAVTIVDADGPIYAEGFGARHLKTNEPATPRTLYGVASCTKSFTAAAVMQLSEAGELAVEDPVDAYIPHLADAPGDPVTIHELLSHTSGIPAHGDLPIYSEPGGLGHMHVPLSSPEDFRRHVEGGLDRRVTDRETLFYYNAGYTMLGLVVEEITGQPIREYIGEHLLDPLGMERSTFSQAEFEAEEDRMTPYVTDEEFSSESAFPFHPFIDASGGLLSSVEEMGTWVRALLGAGSVDGTDVVAPASYEAMITPEATFFETFEGDVIEYGYGLAIQEFLGDRLVGHGGTIGVSNASFGYLEDAELGVAIACATRPEAHITSVAMALLALLQGEEPNAVVPHFKLTSTLERASGEYTTYPDIAEVSVERDGGMLVLTEDWGFSDHEVTLFPDRVSEDLLVCRASTVDGYELKPRFEFDADGVSLFVERARYRKES